MSSPHPARPRRAALWLLPLALILLGGCTGKLDLRPDAPPAVFLLEADTGQATRFSPGGPTLGVSAMRSAAGFDGSDMLYVEQAHQLQSFARHRWADSPARMLEPLLVASAEQSGLFAAVSGPGSHARADLRLDSELLRLQQLFDGAGSQLELVVRASLVETDSGRLLGSRVFRVIEPATEATPYGGVLAANRAAELLMRELQAFVGRAIARRGR